MDRYVYDGPVMHFERCIMNRWVAYTYATSEKMARANLTYQFKKKNNYMPGAKIFLPAEIKLS